MQARGRKALELGVNYGGIWKMLVAEVPEARRRWVREEPGYVGLLSAPEEVEARVRHALDVARAPVLPQFVEALHAIPVFERDARLIDVAYAADTAGAWLKVYAAAMFCVRVRLTE